jgi:hypothetical protein
MSEFSHKPCVIAGQTKQGDRTILYRGHRVGRVYPHIANNDGRFFWSTVLEPAASGFEPNFEAALRAVKAEVEGLDRVVLPRGFRRPEIVLRDGPH